MTRHARDVAPAECCGALLGRTSVRRTSSGCRGSDNAHDGTGVRAARTVVGVVRAPNRHPDVHRAFLIEAPDVLRLERTAASRGLALIGFYHSHPAAPATPSAHDHAAAWPWYSHVIVGGAEADDVRAWRLRDDRSRFEPELLL